MTVDSISLVTLSALRASGVRPARPMTSDGRYDRTDLMLAHGFRKWYNPIVKDNGMAHLCAEKSLGHSIGLDESYYRSKGNIILEGNTLVYSDELSRPSHDEVREFLFNKYEQCKRVDSINVDASFPSEIAMLKKDIIKEEYRIDIYKQWINECKKHGLNPADRMRVVPHTFGQGGGINLLHHAKS